ncbi:aldehyde dehydrogenase (NADP(+)) [Segetibacter sp. 3557_3]|uniref:aldehyde dehydrogenase (NADP(+)) n=1 Tax=Segetibacter sp. 3557_3 TaxID=2547429 RepID=UPI001058C648|nr:aldehyde dehydrogenase (NADP(+)) [Segetibacter sp. 3557_3]TDH24158.1 aldehyde dehydrogenase (NADP(+)) [Segetibacter sp. 3557_3]
MFNGHSHVGFSTRAGSDKKVKVFSTAKQEYLPEEFGVVSKEDMEEALWKATAAFETYKKTTPEQRAAFLENIAEEIINIGDPLIQRAMLETGLPEARLTGERGRTVNQLKLFASLLREGSWVEAVIDPALPDRKPLPRPDLRKMLVPVGPVVVFGASNFPFAFSTAGGDTASALASGCTVVIKAHNAHLGTNELVANAIIKAAQNSGMPDGVFSSLIGEGASLGQALAKHPAVKAIGFTGSYRAGMALYKTAVNDRQVPIPVYAEMSSINPVLVLPGKLEADMDKSASLLAGSITLGVGQFCTNPGLLFVLECDTTEEFIGKLSTQLQAIPAATMLNQSICKSYYTGREKITTEKGVKAIHLGEDECSAYKGSVALFEVNATDFVSNPNLQDEMFGPASMIIRCATADQLKQALHALHGQLTGTIFGTEADIAHYEECIDVMTDKVGRLIYNSVPTGVEVSHAMVHGGPFPATTDGRTTSVGAEAIKRFVRPVCYQDCPEANLPDALKDSNPLGLMRKLDGRYTSDPVTKQ